MNNQTTVESAAKSSQEQVIRNVPEGRANSQIDYGVVELFAWLAVVLLGLIVCTAVAIAFLVRHVQL